MSNSGVFVGREVMASKKHCALLIQRVEAAMQVLPDE
jgi:hypothetical protein